MKTTKGGKKFTNSGNNVLILGTNVLGMTEVNLKIRKKLDNQISAFFKNMKREKESSENMSMGYTFDSLMADKMAIIFLIASGVPYSLFETIQDYAPLEENDWTEILSLNAKTLHRYKQLEKDFGRLQSEKIIEMAEVTNIGLDVFGNIEKFRLWLATPNFALGKSKPIELLKDSYGKELDVSELTHISYGILA
jgi:putative toxin-antitoxin system antitoxin component (TIGR02293 family)